MYEGLILGRPPTFGDEEQINQLKTENDIFNRKQNAADQVALEIGVFEENCAYVLSCRNCGNCSDEDEYDAAFEQIVEILGDGIYACMKCGQRLKQPIW